MSFTGAEMFYVLSIVNVTSQLVIGRFDCIILMAECSNISNIRTQTAVLPSTFNIELSLNSVILDVLDFKLH